MSVRVRLTRVGAKKNAMWRVVVADQRSPRDGRFIEMIGHYNPQTEPSRIVIDRERLDHWLERGAEPSNTVRKLMRAQNSETGAPVEAAVEVAPAEAAAPASDAESVPDAEVAGGAAEPESAAVAESESAAAPASDAESGDAPEADTEPG